MLFQLFISAHLLRFNSTPFLLMGCAASNNKNEDTPPSSSLERNFCPKCRRKLEFPSLSKSREVYIECDGCGSSVLLQRPKEENEILVDKTTTPTGTVIIIENSSGGNSSNRSRNSESDTRQNLGFQEIEKRNIRPVESPRSPYEEAAVRVREIENSNIGIPVTNGNVLGPPMMENIEQELFRERNLREYKGRNVQSNPALDRSHPLYLMY